MALTLTSTIADLIRLQPERGIWESHGSRFPKTCHFRPSTPIVPFIVQLPDQPLGTVFPIG